MKRLWLVWLIFGLCVALAAGAMVRLGATAIALERAEAKARRQAVLEENVQLALWRMDSALAPIMAEESARPYFAYSPLYPAERAFTNMFAEIQKGDVLMPSPLLTFSSPQIRLHFQYGPDGRLSSPQVPAGNMRDLAEARYLPPELIEQASRRLDELGRLVSRTDLAAALAADEQAQSADTNRTLAYGPVLPSKSSNEYLMRSRSTRVAQNAPPPAGESAASAIDREPGPASGRLDRPTLWCWRVGCASRRGPFLQGCWLDWDVIRRDLVEGCQRSRASLKPGNGPCAERCRSRHGCSPRCRCDWSPARSPTSRSQGGPPPASRWRSPGRA